MSKNMVKVVTALLLVAMLAVGVTNAFAAPTFQDQDIVEIAIADGRFNTLVTALQEAELVDTLKGEGPFTVFAPTDEAFAALPEGTLDRLLDDTAALTDVLLYHVVDGKVMAADVVNLSEATTLQGASAEIMVEDGNVMVDGANVIITDIEASNGVIHVIDSVLLPPDLEMDAGTMEAETMEAETMEADEGAMEDQTMETEAETTEEQTTQPADLPSTGGEMDTGVRTIVVVIALGMIVALGGVALRYHFKAN